MAKQKEIPLLTPALFRERYYSAEYRRNNPIEFKGFYLQPTLLKTPVRVHRKPVYEFLFLTKGKSERYKGIDSYVLHKNEFFFTPAYQITGGEHTGADVEGYYCSFELDFFSSLFMGKELFKRFTFLQFAGYPIIKVGKEGLPTIINIIKRIEKAYKEQAADWKDIVGMYLLTLFFELNRYVTYDNTVNSNAAQRVTSEFKKALSIHFKEKQKVTDYADLLAITPNHLNKCIKEATGKSTHELIQEMIVMESKVLLQQTDLPVSDIAYQFSKTPTDFSRLFKAKTGISPTDYRIN